MKKTLIIIFLFFSVCGWGQEILTGMSSNPVVRQKYLDLKMKSMPKSADTNKPVNLPFFDDFSYDSVYPASTLWSDQYAFVNTDIPVYPPNLGAVTLDAIDKDGLMYGNAQPGPTPFIADHLTSRYIRLDSVFSPVPRKLTDADSVYLSFYYQPQGRSRNFPLSQDSLLLRFLVAPARDSITPTDTIHIPELWKKVWHSNGMSLDTFRFYNDEKYFVQVMIPILDTHLFFKKTFRFQFYNYVNFAAPPEYSWMANCDQWNIDNVYLSYGRNINDTVRPEIRFMDRAPSMLRNYESMPYPHYTAAPETEMADSVSVILNNRDIQQHNCRYSYKVSNSGGSFVKTFIKPTFNVQPVYNTGPLTLYPTVPWFYPITEADSAEFLMQHLLHDNAPSSAFGDTLLRNQQLYNYFAYDDGTPEASYGLTPAGSMLAYRFNLNKPDTLRAIQLYFNQIYQSTSQLPYFYLCVWNDNVGTPGDTIYSKFTIPLYSNRLNKFYTYHIPPLPVNGTIYVGWIQTTADNLCLGFDTYNDHHDRIYYNTSGRWFTSSFTGSLMIRPIVGKPIPLGIEEEEPVKGTLSLWPNPCAGGKLNLKRNSSTTSSARQEKIVISDLSGRTVMSLPYTEQVDVSKLRHGIYFISVSGSVGRNPEVKKLIIAP
jgi:hypothetical protein